MSIAIDEMLRVEGGRVLATLIRLTGDIALAEDAVQDAILVALERWPKDGVPLHPAAWLTTAARHKAFDRMRRDANRRVKERAAVLPLQPGQEPLHDSVIRDDQLRLLFTCCHPALAPEARIALALRTIGGLTTTEIARAFLIPEATMGQRISRAKRKIATAHIPYRVPADHELPDRLPSVLAVVYSIFTAGHHAPHGRLDGRIDLADEGLRLARLLTRLMPDEPECAGLLALAQAVHGRHRARIDATGELVLMADQDRSLWDHAAIAEAASLVDRTLRRGRPGPYQLQAAIACLHGVASSFADTDWPQIAVLYRLLEYHLPTPVVRVNRAVAEAEAFGPQVGLSLLDDLTRTDARADLTRADLTRAGVEGWHMYWSTRAEFERRLGRFVDAGASFGRALECPTNDSDRRFLQRRLAETADDVKAVRVGVGGVGLAP